MPWSSFLNHAGDPAAARRHLRRDATASPPVDVVRRPILNERSDCTHLSQRTGQQSQTRADHGCFSKEPPCFLCFTTMPFHP
jgi:hypothetical protein